MIKLLKGNGSTSRFSGRCNNLNDTGLKSYDIASFDIELEYNKKITPINKKVDKLNSSHESKSLSAHKDFLTKEKKSKEKMNELSDKAIIKNQKIEKAVENKIKKLRSKESRLKKDNEAFESERNELANIELEKLIDIDNQLKQEEKQDINEIKDKYKTNIESYVEKLNIYNSNFENNKQFHVNEITKYQDILNQNISDLNTFNESVVIDLEEKLAQFVATKESSDTEINENRQATSRLLTNLATDIRKKSNVKINSIDEYIELLKDEYQNHYEPDLVLLDNQITEIKAIFEERRGLIDRDLEMNITKLETMLEELKESRNKKAKRNILSKIDLFNLRATTTIKYEERILNEKIILLENEKSLLKETLEFELFNFDKLKVFMLNDENELKETGDYFKELNLILKTELNNFELSNNDYLLKHEQLKTDFVKNYTKIFADLKENTVNLAQTYLEKIADNNFEIDEINKFLDTAEPLKEIKVNRLRENIEISEVIERFKIKYSKQDYEKRIIKNVLHTEVAIEEFGLKEKLSENNKDMIDIKNKEIFDKALEKAKLKHSKAQEVYNLRLNNTKLERNLLTNKYDTELAISTHKKALAEINVRKHNALISKEIEYAIKNYEMEANYKIEVINKGLEEDLLKLEEKVSKAKYEKDAYLGNSNLEVDRKLMDITVLKDDIVEKTKVKVDLINQALERELKEPSRNILKTETIIDERLSKLDINNAIYVDFINDSIEDYKDNKLTIEQIREIIINNDIVYDKSVKYVNRTYAVLLEAVKFMNDIEKHSGLNKIASTSDQSSIKKLKKHQTKLELENAKQFQTIKTSENDHVVLIRNFIAEELTKIKKANLDDITALVNFTEESYNKIFNHLKDLQSNIKKEIAVLYSPLTSNDQELIDYANKNAETALSKVEQEKQNEFAPLDEELNNFINSKEEAKNEFYSHYDTEINELKAEINHHKNVALEKVREITSEKRQLVDEKSSQKQAIQEREEREVVQRYEDIDHDSQLLEQNYQLTLTKLNEKDQEAKKIFDYEDRIHNIAVESATARFNDANQKASNIHMNSVKQYRNEIEKAKHQKEQNILQFNRDLLALTKSFEKNIFTVRPRLEESIGDAQKAIDIEIKDKKQQLSDLIENNNKIILSAETRLYTAFQEGYDRLNNNLQNYIDKYRVIESKYIADNNQSNDVLNANNITFNNALFELGKNKHAKTLLDLKKVNQLMTGEGE